MTTPPAPPPIPPPEPINAVQARTTARLRELDDRLAWLETLARVLDRGTTPPPRPRPPLQEGS